MIGVGAAVGVGAADTPLLVVDRPTAKPTKAMMTAANPRAIARATIPSGAPGTVLARAVRTRTTVVRGIR